MAQSMESAQSPTIKQDKYVLTRAGPFIPIFSGERACKRTVQEVAAQPPQRPLHGCHGSGARLHRVAIC